MPKKGGKRGGGGDSTRIPFHQIVTNAFVAGLFGFSAHPTGVGGRILTEADAWAHFRWRRFSFRLLRVGTVTSAQAAGWVGGVQDTSPSTIAQVAELLPSTLLQGTSTVPSSWVHVRKVDLSGPFTWYKTLPGTADATEEAPAIISVVGTGTETFFLEIRGEIEFKTGVSTGNTPEELALRERLRQIRSERERAMAAASIQRLMCVVPGTEVKYQPYVVQTAGGAMLYRPPGPSSASLPGL